VASTSQNPAASEEARSVGVPVVVVVPDPALEQAKRSAGRRADPIKRKRFPIVGHE
jgi:hypothetical protein